ncbi:MAG TPA: ribosomal protein S18-alanine N-acetyltransferase [Longimicrobiales bacterium]
MRREDLPRVMEIEHASYTVPWPETSFRGLLRRSDASVFVAEVDGAIAGYAASWAVLDQGELGNIAVAPEHRGRGIAKRLMDAVIEDMRERGVRELFLEVRVTNSVARHLYEQYGFEEVGCRADYYTGPVEDAIIMRKRIERPAES